MKKKSRYDDSSLLRRALRIAAVEAYHSEVLETGMYELVIGTGKEYPTADMWIRDRINQWIQEAELNLPNT